jgi:signal transduction histidine kinase
MPDLDTIRSTLARIPNPIAVLESLFALAPVGFQIYEATGRSILVNQAFLELFGSEPPPGYNVLEDEIAARNGVLETIRRAFKGETVQTPPIWYDPRELQQVNVKQGRRVAMAATFFPLLDRYNAVTHVAIVFRDMTAELTHREQLEQERELLAAVVDQVSEGILMADPAGTLRLVNRAARAMGVEPGTPFEQWRERYGLRSAEGNLLDARETPLGRALQGETASAVIQHQLPNGAVRSLSSVAVPLRAPDGSSRGAVVTFRDETDRLLREREAEQAAHFRERFIGILGHDLRTPLTSILASAGLLLRDAGAEDKVRVPASRIAGSARRMRRMISDLLDFTDARLGGGLPVQRRPCDLGEVARTVADKISAANPDRVIALDVSGDVTGSFDPDRAAQLLCNLLENAVAYGPPDDRVRVRLAGHQEAVEIVVENGGPAILPRERAVLFDPFRRGAAQPGRGLGLGLFIVQQIARAHGGDVEVESSNRRTVFRARFQR